MSERLDRVGATKRTVPNPGDGFWAQLGFFASSLRGGVEWHAREPFGGTASAPRQSAPRQNYFIAPPGMGMSELKMSHWVTHFPSTFFEASIHLPWSRWEPSAAVITYVPVP